MLHGKERAPNMSPARSSVKVVSLAGGHGTRLREETEFRPKPMVEIGGRPILWHIMKIYAQFGFKDFIVCLGYKGSLIKEYFLNYQAMNNDFTISLGKERQIVTHGNHAEHDYTVTLVDTGLDTPTGGRIKMIEKFIVGPVFLATYGDGVADLDIESLLRFHEQQGRLATVTAVRPLTRYGLLELDGRSGVQQFREKPVADGHINGGFFVFNRGVFDYLNEGSVLEHEPLERLAADGELSAYQHNGFWQPVDTYREYLFLNALWENGAAPWRTWDQVERTREQPLSVSV
jgi:glucose-1-phosphate cytidylyltransferase